MRVSETLSTGRPAEDCRLLSIINKKKGRPCPVFPIPSRHQEFNLDRGRLSKVLRAFEMEEKAGFSHAAVAS